MKFISYTNYYKIIVVLSYFFDIFIKWICLHHLQYIRIDPYYYVIFLANNITIKQNNAETLHHFKIEPANPSHVVCECDNIIS